MSWLWITGAWILTLLISFFSGMFLERGRWTDIVSDEEIKVKAKKKGDEKKDEIKNTDPHNTDKYVSDDTNEHISGVIDDEAEQAVAGLRELSRRNRKRSDSGG